MSKCLLVNTSKDYSVTETRVVGAGGGDIERSGSYPRTLAIMIVVCFKENKLCNLF